MLYWTEGEGFAGAATLEAIARFLTHSLEDVRRTLQRSASLAAM